MNAIWNLPVLERPPYITWRIKPLDAKKRGLDISRFKTVLTIAIHDLKSMNDLHLNAAILSRMIYRMKTKFRNDKGLKYMMKLNKTLLNYYNMSLEKEYVTLKSDLRMEDGVYILPSRQNLEYVLVKTQGFGKLMTRIEEISRCTSHLLKARIKLGHAWTVALMAFATTSRIWFHVRNIIKKCCKWYDELYQCAEQFQYIGTKLWLPTNQSLPHNLKSWLCIDLPDVDVIDANKSQTWHRIFGETFKKICNDTETSSVIPNEETDDSKMTQVEIALENNILEEKYILNTNISDIGEVITREGFEKNLSNNKSKTTKRKYMDTNEKKNQKESRRKRKKKNGK